MKICRFCNKPIKKKDLSRHSINGRHMIPYVLMHIDCHRNFHLENPNYYYTKLNQKWLKEIEDETS